MFTSLIFMNQLQIIVVPIKKKEKQWFDLCANMNLLISTWQEFSFVHWHDDSQIQCLHEKKMEIRERAKKMSPQLPSFLYIHYNITEPLAISGF